MGYKCVWLIITQGLFRKLGFAFHDCPSTIDDSRFTIDDSRFTIDDSRLTIHVFHD